MPRTSGIVNDVIFPIWSMALVILMWVAGAVLQQVVVNFQRSSEGDALFDLIIVCHGRQVLSMTALLYFGNNISVY